MLEQGGLDQRQQAIVEGLFRAIEPGTYLSEHVGGLSSAVLALVRAHHVLDGNARLAQPRLSWTKTVLTQSLRDVNVATPAYNVTAAGAALISRAKQLLVNTIDTIDTSPTPTSPEKHSLATLINALVQPAAMAVRAAFELAWNDPSLPEDVAVQIRSEAAVLSALEGRDGHTLQRELQKRLKKDTPAGSSTVADVLWPVRRIYRVATVVLGARNLEKLNQLLPDAKQWALTGTGVPSEFSGSPEMRALVTSARPAGGKATLVQIPEEAADARTAIHQARRRMIETLDQYAAGQRLLDLRLSQLSLATDPTNKTITSEAVVGGGKVARPLTSHWSDPLRPALRMANLAKQVEGPVASTALSWSAIESLGVSPRDIEDVAKACSLHTVRQQILSVYQTVTYSSIARIRHTQWKSEMLASKLRKAENGSTKAARSKSLLAAQALPTLTSRAAALRRAHADAKSRHLQSVSELIPHVETVRQTLLGGGDLAQPMNMTSWELKDLNIFMDALLPIDASTSRGQASLKNAISAMAQKSGGLALQLFATWEKRLTDPRSLSDWIEQQQSFFRSLLEWMYVSRNLAFHTGQFTAPADALTAHASRDLVDMILEFLGNWHQGERSKSLPESPARDILILLSRRKDILSQKLSTASSCHLLNVSQITALDCEVWARR